MKRPAPKSLVYAPRVMANGDVVFLLRPRTAQCVARDIEKARKQVRFRNRREYGKWKRDRRTKLFCTVMAASPEVDMVALDEYMRRSGAEVGTVEGVRFIESTQAA
jgi:hypothetical protein